MTFEDETGTSISPNVRIPGRAVAMLRDGQEETEAVLLVPAEVASLEFVTGDEVVEQLRVGLLET